MNEDGWRFLPDALHIGIADIDAQHEGLFRQLVALKGLCLGHNLLPANEAAGLLAALEEHYATEAQWAAEFSVDFTAHGRSHQKMLGMVSKALNEAVEGRADVFSTLRYIEYWFERHIAHEDSKLGEALSWQPGHRPAAPVRAPVDQLRAAGLA